MTTGVISIELTEEDAQLFRLFREQQDNFMTMVESGVFNVRGGSAVLHFDQGGTLGEVNLNVTSFKRGRPILQVVTVA